MRAARQPAQHIFGADDREREALERAVDGGGDHQPAGPHHLGAARDEQLHVGDVLDHFHRQHDVEAFAGIGQRLGGGGAIVDRDTRLLGMQLCHRDIALGRIGADDGRAEPRQRLRQNAAAAADIEDAQAFQAIELLGVAVEPLAGGVADVGEPHRIELVQHRHLAARVPPLLGQRRKARDFGVRRLCCMVVPLVPH